MYFRHFVKYRDKILYTYSRGKTHIVDFFSFAKSKFEQHSVDVNRTTGCLLQKSVHTIEKLDIFKTLHFC